MVEGNRETRIVLFVGFKLNLDNCRAPCRKKWFCKESSGITRDI
jgi:hypothetical protein